MFREYILMMLVIQLAKAAIACLKYTSYQCSIKLITVYLISHRGSPTQTYTQRSFIQYSYSLTLSTESIRARRTWRQQRGNMSEPEKTGDCVLHRGKGLGFELLTMCFYAKPSPSWLKTFLRTGNVLLHSVTPLRIYLYIFIYIYNT